VFQKLKLKTLLLSLKKLALKLKLNKQHSCLDRKPDFRPVFFCFQQPILLAIQEPCQIIA
jgi:hypothetical protein